MASLRLMAIWFLTAASPLATAIFLFVASFLFVANLAFPLDVFAQQLPTKAAIPPGENALGQPRLLIDSPTLEVGEVEPGALLTRDFIFTNQGEAPLEILEVRPGCSCAIPKFDAVVAPGQTGRVTIPIKIYPEWAGQKFRKAAWILTNDPLTPQLRLIISGQVAPLTKASTP